jgi:FkbM family methyltransferase
MEENICWHTEGCAEEMNQAFENFKKSNDNLFHLMTLKELILTLDSKGSTVLDLGCGTGFISEFFNGYKYIGADLPHILHGCAMKNYPEYAYRQCDIQQDLSWIKEYDIVLMNAVIDVMQNPIEILNKVLANAKEHVIIHRQEISETKPTQVSINSSYNAKTYHSIINRKDFENILEENNFYIVKELECGFANWEKNGSSFLLRKRKSWALNFMDWRINKLFKGKEKGFFIEAGAVDGVRQSNTFFLEFYKDWRGLLIEPVNENYEKCVDNRSKRTIVERAALVSNEYGSGSIDIYYTPECYGLMSVIDGFFNTNKHLQKEGSKKYKKQNVPALTLNAILEKHKEMIPPVIDLLVLDIEGYEIEAIKGIDFEKWNIQYLLIEELEGDDAVGNYMDSKGYGRIERWGHDYLYERRKTS